MVYNNPDFGMNDLTACGGIGKWVVPDSQDSDFNIQDYLGNSMSLEATENNETATEEERENYLENIFNEMEKQGGQKAEFAKGFKDFLNGLFDALKEQFGIDVALKDFTKDVLNSSDDSGMMSGVVSLIKTGITAWGYKLDDDSSKNT